MPEASNKGEHVHRGIPVSAGVVRGKILIIGQPQAGVPKRQIAEHQVGGEINRLEQALIQTRREIVEIQQKVRASVGTAEGDIFDAHLLVLEDPVLIQEVTRTIEQEHANAEYAFHTVAEKYATALAAIEDEYLRERATDMRDVTARMLNNLLGHAGPDLRHLPESCIIISHDLTPSTTAQLDRHHVLGFATDIGSQTSHTAIMARSMGIPAVVGLKDASTILQTGDYVLLDGFNGLVIVNPTSQTLFEYGQLVRRQVALEDKLRDQQDKPAVTLDGHRVLLTANIEQAEDAESVLTCGAEGVGLFRTEYLFINRNALPSEEEQFESYHRVAARLKPHPVVFRTLDLGGDKFLSLLNVPHEMNPFLGWRAIRLCLQETDMFRTQLRAILRASAVGNVKIMYPMISGLAEVDQANALLAECQAQLRAENKPFDEQMKVGVMIEIPSAAMVAGALARRTRFFSLGTNDLIQYTLAVDRLNEKIAHLYEPTHPAILRLIKLTVDAAHQNGITVSVCGEMGGDPVLAPLLLGLGLDELSAAPTLIPRMKFFIRRLKLSEAKELAEFALGCESGAEIYARALALAKRVAPSLFESTL
jgi:phosphotransferase system enzyme I (PtsI)